MSLTGTVFQVLLMNRRLLDDWLYDKVRLQLLGAVGTVGMQVEIVISFTLTSQVKAEYRIATSVILSSGVYAARIPRPFF